MARVALVGAKGAPGATTSTLALAYQWPRAVLVVDADLGGGDIAAGWLGAQSGHDRGLLSFAAATRHTGTPSAADLAAHTTAVTDKPGLMILTGLAHAGQAPGIDAHLWQRLTTAAAEPWPAHRPVTRPGRRYATRHGHAGDNGTGDDDRGDRQPQRDSLPPSGPRVDVLVDCGRIAAATAWPLLRTAHLVLLVTRPTLRGVHHARHALTALRAELADLSRVGLLLCGQGPYDPAEVSRAVDLPVRVVLPHDPAAAAVLSDSAAGRGWPHTALGRTARTAAGDLVQAASAAGREEARR